MGCPRICVVTTSPTIRETVAIVLGPAFEILGLAPEECATKTERLVDADLLIVSGDFSPHAALITAAARLPLLTFAADTCPAGLLSTRSATMPLAFRPEHLRRQVRQLLAAPVAAAVPPRSSFLDYPFLSPDLAELARRAAATLSPVLISGEPGTGKSRLARALHAAGAQGRFVSLPGDRLTPAGLAHLSELPAGPITLYIHDVAHLGVDQQRILHDICETGGVDTGTGWRPCRLIGATAASLDGLAADEGFDADLFYRLSVLPMTLLPLRHRPNDIADLAAALARDLGGTIPNGPFSFTGHAVERMQRYMWFGNVAELEAVLLRSMTMATSARLDVDDLLFDSTRVAPRRLPASPAAEAQSTPASATTPDAEPPAVEAGELAAIDAEAPRAPEQPAECVPPVPPAASDTMELVIQELAHEFRNPMVTIKTFTQRLERLLEDKASRDQVARLTGEAVDRMDRALENLLQFTRFGKPVTEAVALSPLVTGCLSHLSPAFAERQVLLNYEPPESHRVEVDGAQVGYALENLLRVILRDLRDGDTLAIHPLNGHGISLEFPARGQLVAQKLAALADCPPDGKAAAQSIGFLFAKALVERNGGNIEIQPGTGRTVIAVALPAQGDAASENGHASNSSR